MAKKKALAYTFLQRVAHFVADVPPCMPRQEFADMQLLQLGSQAWQYFVANRPRTASLSLAAAHSVWGYLACTCDAACSATSLLDRTALANGLVIDDLANAILRSLLVPEIEIPRTSAAKTKHKNKLTLAGLLLIASHSAGSDHISSFLGIILLFQVALRCAQTLAADDAPGLLAELERQLCLPESQIL